MRHTVEEGESIDGLAIRYQSSGIAVRRASGAEAAEPGVELEVPLPYVTRPGDTLEGVAQRFGIDPGWVSQLNPDITDGLPLQPTTDPDEASALPASTTVPTSPAAAATGATRPDDDHTEVRDERRHRGILLPPGETIYLPGTDEVSMLIEEVTQQEYLASGAVHEGVDYEVLARRCLTVDRSSVAHAAKRLGAVREERRAPLNPWDDVVGFAYVIAGLGVVVVIAALVVGGAQWLISKVIDGFVGLGWVDTVGTIAFAAMILFFGAGLVADKMSARADAEFLRRSRWASRRRDFNDAVRNFIVLPAIQDLMLVHFDDVGSVNFDASALTTAASITQIVRTDTYREMARHLARADGATLGLRGARGSGKTDLLRAFCRVAATTGSDSLDDDQREVDRHLDDERVVGVFIAAPTSPDEYAFLRRVALLVCDRTLRQDTGSTREMATRRQADWFRHVIGPVIIASGIVIALRLPNRLEAPHLGLAVAAIGLALTVAIEIGHRVSRRHERSGHARGWRRRDKQRDASRQLRQSAAAQAQKLQRQLRYATTTEDNAEGGAAVSGLSAKVSRTVSLTEYPLTKDDVVEDLSSLIRLLDDAGTRVIIGIDELDRLEVEEKTAELLNTMKALFAIPACSFIVTISDSAWATFEQRGLKVRTVFDSSFDDIIEVRPLTFRGARSILRARGALLSDSQVLLVNTMAGGVARDMIRQARAFAESTNTVRTAIGHDAGRDHDVVRDYLDADARSKVDAALLELRTEERTKAIEDATLQLDRFRDSLGDYDLDRLLDELRRLCEADVSASGSNGGDPSTDPTVARAAKVLSRTIAYLAFVQLVAEAFGPEGPIHLLARERPEPYEELPADAFEPYQALVETYQWLGSSCRSSLSRLERAAEIVRSASALSIDA